MARLYEIRADYDAETIVVYQAYPASIAAAALEAQRFVAPFSFNRMTWIKPSFLWLMHRSNWGQKAGQEMVLAVRIRRAGWDSALSAGVLTSPEKRVFKSADDWDREFAEARVHVQWDTERSLRGAPLAYYSIQVGLSRHLIREYAESWIVRIDDLTPLVRKLNTQLRTGHADKAQRQLPRERPYAVAAKIARRLGMDA
ncbi:MAG: DUF4291 domain-containing protein [Polyangiaceae bacterium]|nr:DUF4291 domain-containing protein [Polyangiaceae bacterium]